MFFIFIWRSPPQAMEICCLCPVCILFQAVPINAVNCGVYRVTSLSAVCPYMWYSLNESRNNSILSAEQTVLSLPCQLTYEVVGAVWESREQSFGLIKSKVIEINECHWRNGVELLLRENCFELYISRKFVMDASKGTASCWSEAGGRWRYPQQGACHVLALILQSTWSAESHFLLGTEDSCFTIDR